MRMGIVYSRALLLLLISLPCNSLAETSGQDQDRVEVPFLFCYSRRESPALVYECLDMHLYGSKVVDYGILVEPSKISVFRNILSVDCKAAVFSRVSMVVVARPDGSGIVAVDLPVKHHNFTEMSPSMKKYIPMICRQDGTLRTADELMAQYGSLYRAPSLPQSVIKVLEYVTKQE